MPGGAPKGNTNASKTKLWGDTIRHAIVQADAEKLRKLADKLIENALSGDMQALKEIGDRLDGKSVQSIDAKVRSRVIVNIK